MPAAKRAFFWRREAKSLRTSRGGFEEFGLQTKPRPAVCRRIPPSRLCERLGDTIVQEYTGSRNSDAKSRKTDLL